MPHGTREKWLKDFSQNVNFLRKRKMLCFKGFLGVEKRFLDCEMIKFWLDMLIFIFLRDTICRENVIIMFTL